MGRKSRYQIIYERMIELSKVRIDFEPKRINKAYELVKAGTPLKKYYKTNLYTCDCMDNRYRGLKFICKHRLYLLFKKKLEDGELEQGDKVVKIGYRSEEGKILLFFPDYVEVLFKDEIVPCDELELVKI